MPTAAYLARMWHVMTALSHRPMAPEPSVIPLNCKYVAEREGFEPPGRLHDRLLSRTSHDLTLTVMLLVRGLAASPVSDL
jgi:hypothetical protein